MNRRLKLLIIVTALLLSCIVVLNQFILASTNNELINNWKNDSLFYVLSILLWAIILPFFYDLVKKLHDKHRGFVLYLIVAAFILSLFHQFLANLIFQSILSLIDGQIESLKVAFFFRLVLGGLLARFIEALVFAVFFYFVLEFSDAIIRFISTIFPNLYKWLLGDSVNANLAFVEKGVTISINKKNIVRIESAGNYTKVITQDKAFLPRIGISKLRDELDPAIFIQVHRSHIINRNAVISITYLKNGEYKIEFINGNSINSSRKYSSQIKLIFKSYLIGSNISSQN